MYYMVEDIQNDDFYYVKAKSRYEAIMKAHRFWNANDPYVDFEKIKVREVEKEEYKKYVNR